MICPTPQETTSVFRIITAESLSDLKKLELHIVMRLRHDSRVSKAVIRIVNGIFEEVTLYNGSKRDISRAVSWNEIKDGWIPNLARFMLAFAPSRTKATLRQKKTVLQ